MVVAFPDLRSGRDHTAHTRVPALACCFLTGPHTLTASFCRSPSAQLPRLSSHPGSLLHKKAAGASPQNHSAVKASVPKRFGLSRCFHPLLPQLNAKRSAGFLIHQLAPANSQAPGASIAHIKLSLPGGPPLTTFKTYNIGRSSLALSSLALASSCSRLCALSGAAHNHNTLWTSATTRDHTGHSPSQGGPGGERSSCRAAAPCR